MIMALQKNKFEDITIDIWNEREKIDLKKWNKRKYDHFR